MRWAKVAAAALAAIAIILLGYAIFAGESQTDDVSTPGMGDRHVYSSTNLALIVVSSFLIAMAVMFILLREEYEPLPSSLKPVPPPDGPENDADRATPPPTAPSAEAPIPGASERTAAEEARERYLTLRLLTGDERRMFKAIMDAGGEALQKDLIVNTKMSNAKVSRVLDRLMEKGVITKERHGSTNRVRISFDEE